MLITGELLLRREVGETLDIGEYQTRFPEFVDRIAVQFCVDDFLSSTDGVDAQAASDEVRDLELSGYEFLEEIGRGAVGCRLQGTAGIARPVRGDQGGLHSRRRCQATGSSATRSGDPGTAAPSQRRPHLRSAGPPRMLAPRDGIRGWDDVGSSRPRDTSRRPLNRPKWR